MRIEDYFFNELGEACVPDSTQTDAFLSNSILHKGGSFKLSGN